MHAFETIELEGPYQFDLTLYVVPDTYSDPSGMECYDADDIAGYHDGSWEYVGYVVTASRDGIELGSASIWGTEYGSIGGREYGSAEFIAEQYYLPYLINEATEEARASIAKLTLAL